MGHGERRNLPLPVKPRIGQADAQVLARGRGCLLFIQIAVGGGQHQTPLAVETQVGIPFGKLAPRSRTGRPTASSDRCPDLPPGRPGCRARSTGGSQGGEERGTITGGGTMQRGRTDAALSLWRDRARGGLLLPAAMCAFRRASRPGAAPGPSFLDLALEHVNVRAAVAAYAFMPSSVPRSTTFPCGDSTAEAGGRPRHPWPSRRYCANWSAVAGQEATPSARRPLERR